MAAAQPERRTVKRWIVDCEARLKMPGGDRDGWLSDLSSVGARLDTPNPPAQGTSGLLEWRGEEHFCKVIWSNDKGCGVAFDRVLPLEIVQQTAEMVEEETGPIANFGRIPLGQKRSRRISLVSGGADET